MRFATPGIYFRRPQNLYAPAVSDGAAFRRQLNMTDADPLYLCPQSLPKFHPAFDEVLLRLVAEDERARVVITYDPKKALWLHVLQGRLGHHPQIVFLPLALGDKFFGLLRASTLLLDPFPFGGGVTTLEAFSVCRLVVTAPALQSVVALAAGFYRRLNIADAPIVDSVDAYVKRARELAADAAKRGALEAAVCRAGGNLFNDDESVEEWASFLRRASSGAAPAPFSNTGSTTVSGISLAAASTLRGPSGPPGRHMARRRRHGRRNTGRDGGGARQAESTSAIASRRPTSRRRGTSPSDADVASNPALFDRAVAEAAAAAS